MRRFALIFGFLCTVSLPGFSETYTIKFGDLPGGLEIQYEITDRIVGKITNTSPVPIGCRNLEIKRIGATLPLLLDNSEVHLDSGASQAISRENPFFQTKLESWAGKECYTGLVLEFKNQSDTKRYPWGKITGTVGDTFITVSLENNSEEPAVIDWNGSWFVDGDKSASRIALRRGNYLFDELPQVVSPRTALQKEIVPRKNMSGCGMMAPCYRPLVPAIIAPELAEKAMKDYADGKISIVLQITIEGKKTSVPLDFEVKSIKAIQPRLSIKRPMIG
jgi:hypothetical protein